MKVHVCIVSDALLANVLPAMIDRPDRIYLMTTPRMEERAEELRQMLERDRMDARIWQDPSDGRWPQTAESAQALAERVLKAAPNAEVILNVTGGLKTMAFALVLGFRGTQHRVIYVDMGHDVIHDLALPTPPEQPIPDVIDLRRYLRASGFDVSRSRFESDNLKWRQAAEEACELSDHLAAVWPSLGVFADVLNGAAEQARASYKRARKAEQALPRLLSIAGDLALANTALMERLVAAGLIDWSADQPASMRIANAAAADYLGGIWLEQYGYYELCELGLTELAAGVTGSWQRGNESLNPNELDLVAVHRNRLLYIECKAGVFRTDQKIQDKFGKIDAIGNRVVGDFGAVMLLSPRPLSPPAIQRALAGHIFPLHGSDITRVAEVVQHWMQVGRLPPYDQFVGTP